MKQIATEKSGIQNEWMTKAKEMKTLSELQEFIRHLVQDFEHDYGTICHAIAAGMVAVGTAMNRSECGGISGFQAGAVQWEFIKGRGVCGEGPLQLVEWNNLLYPQYDMHLPRGVSPRTFDSIREKAKEKHAEFSTGSPVHEDVAARVALLAEGGKPKWLVILDH